MPMNEIEQNAGTYENNENKHRHLKITFCYAVYKLRTREKGTKKRQTIV